MPATGPGLQVRTVAVEPFLQTITPMYAQVTPSALHQRRKMKNGVLPYHDRLPARDHLVIHRRGKISARDRDKRVLFEEDLRTGEMNFHHSFLLVIADQQIRHLRRITVHRSAGTDAPVAETMPAQVLYCIEQAGFNNGESHSLILIWWGSQRWLHQAGLPCKIALGVF